MRKQNNIIKKSVFALPLLAMLLIVTSVCAKINVTQNSFLNEVVFQKQSHKDKDLNAFDLTSLDEVQIILSEIEAESELEFELKWGVNASNHSSFLKIATEKESFFSPFQPLQKNQKVPLYDLFCNWKHFIS